jgi:hypothetical protein
VATVAVDFDGVIHDYKRGWQDGSIYGEFVPGAVAALSRLMSEYAVFVHTARNARQVARWIEDRSGHGIECVTTVHPLPWKRAFWNQRGLLLVTNRKLPAIAYIDDRAIRFESWPQALADLAGGGKQAASPAAPTGLDKVQEAVRRVRGGDPPAQVRGFA